jgi:hypothetical protein
MGSGASTKLDLSSIENLDHEFKTHGDDAVRLAWELTAKQISSNSELEMQLCQLRRLASTLDHDPYDLEGKNRRFVFFLFPSSSSSGGIFTHTYTEFG